MSKMTVIQLLNKIANGEIGYEQKIKIDNEIVTISNLLSAYIFDKKRLNDEIEIIEEEKKIPEKLKDILRVDDLIPPVDENMHRIWKQTIKNQNKINEICDYLNSKGE